MGVVVVPELPMTQQYIIGEFSSWLAALQPVPDEVLGDALRGLRREVETGPLSVLPRLAQQAITLTDMICWDVLERGDVAEFRRQTATAAALREFAVSAHLLP